MIGRLLSGTIRHEIRQGGLHYISHTESCINFLGFATLSESLAVAMSSTPKISAPPLHSPSVLCKTEIETITSSSQIRKTKDVVHNDMVKQDEQ